MSQYFKPLEFLACTPSCDIAQMDKNFLNALDLLREKCGFPLVLNCAYRSREWDISRGRSGDSWHTKGLAVDIRCYDAVKRATIVYHALSMDFSVGVYSSFIHLDDRFVASEGRIPQVLFYGLSSS